MEIKELLNKLRDVIGNLDEVSEEIQLRIKEEVLSKEEICKILNETVWIHAGIAEIQRILMSSRVI